MRSQLQNMEHYQFASRVLQLCNEAKVGKLTAVLGPLTACVAAEAVDRVMKAYPDVAASNYDKETGLIKNLVADLRTTALAPHVARRHRQSPRRAGAVGADHRTHHTV